MPIHYQLLSGNNCWVPLLAWDNVLCTWTAFCLGRCSISQPAGQRRPPGTDSHLRLTFESSNLSLVLGGLISCPGNAHLWKGTLGPSEVNETGRLINSLSEPSGHLGHFNVTATRKL